VSEKAQQDEVACIWCGLLTHTAEAREKALKEECPVSPSAAHEFPPLRLSRLSLRIIDEIRRHQAMLEYAPKKGKKKKKKRRRPE
jgi:hypothetical protein